jgi:PAS domain S-box-containing protein
MSFSLGQALVAIIGYLTLLFGVAHAAEKGWISKRITEHPAVYILSLGVFAGAMATNGAVELAHWEGYGALTYFLGATLAFMASALILFPVLRLCRIYQLSSLADLLTFRFRSEFVGAGITIAMCLALLPFFALQIQAVADSIHIIASGAPDVTLESERHDGLAFLFCLIVIIFAILFGTRNPLSKVRNTGLVTAIAFESIMKLLAFSLAGVLIVWQVFGDFGAFDAWFAANREILIPSIRADTDASTRTALMLFFASTVCMPHIFHMIFAENPKVEELRTASWALPLFLLALSLPVLPIAWASLATNQPLAPEYAALGIGIQSQSPAILMLSFVATLSAASATLIVSTLALSNMCLKHLVLPLSIIPMDTEHGIYRQLIWIRRLLIALLILAGFASFLVISHRETLAQLGLIAFVGTAQFLPGVIASLYWPSANRIGLLGGLSAGLFIWGLLLLAPLILGQSVVDPDWFESTGLDTTITTTVSLAVNILIFLSLSMILPTTREEKIAAEICSMDDLNRPARQSLNLRSAQEFIVNLAAGLGEDTARAEVNRAMRELQFEQDESRPYALRRLRARLEANLSGLLGPSVAHSMVSRYLPYSAAADDGSEDINLIELQLDRAQLQFTGLAADLNNLRHHYRETLNTLPIGVCSLGSDGEILMWNESMEFITRIPADDVLGSLITEVREPWGRILTQFSAQDTDQVVRQKVQMPNKQSRWVSLHKSPILDNALTARDRVIVVEDITEYVQLEHELMHNERLASIGRLAAGVAHEVGNPVTGIACLAQNLAYAESKAEIDETASDILKQTQRISRIVESLVRFSHAGDVSSDNRLAPCNVADCADEAANLLLLDPGTKHVSFINECDREILVIADPQKLLQIFINLYSNARDACDIDGKITTSARIKKNGRVEIMVEDDGAGIPEHEIERIFEPFFTTKDPGAGTGLGLALVFTMMEEMEGEVDVRSTCSPEESSGTRFLLTLNEGRYNDA